MFNNTHLAINSAAVHFVGNKLKDDELKLSTELSSFDEPTLQILWRYVSGGFKAPDFYQFTHVADLEMNNMFKMAERIFSNQDDFLKPSQDIAKLLFDCSQHPQIKSGELIVMYFKKLHCDDFSADAIGIFKSEKKEPFLFTQEDDSIIDIHSFQGISPTKVDKACLIFNQAKEDGYQVLAVDNLNKGEEAKFWFEDFLKIKPRSTQFSKTTEIISLTKDFILNDLDSDSLLDKTEQMDLLNKSASFFKENDSFDQEEFAVEVFEDKAVADRFRSYTLERDSNDFNFEEGFDISQQAVKQKQRVFKSVLKLDKNFSVYIHGNKEMIEKGVDESGRKYYKLYFDEEN